jgi:Flp pilus assembly protein TadD
MNTLLVAVLSFGAIWLYLLAVKSTRPAGRWTLLIGAAFFFVLALWAKPAAVAVPLMAALLDRLATRRPWRQIAAPAVVGLLVAVPVIVITRRMQTGELVTPTPLWSRPIVALDAVAFYLWKLFVPARLLVDYGRTPQWLIDRPHVWASGLVTIAVAVACWTARRRWPWLWIGLAVFVAALLPVLGLTPFDVQMISTVTDRYLYLAMIGPAMVAAFALSRANGRAPYAVAALLLIALAVRSNVRARDWRDEFTLFEPELVHNPRSLAAHQVLGVTYSARQDFEQAAGHLQQALETKPDDSRSLFNLGNLMLRFGRFEEAVGLYRRALEKFPKHPRIHNNLGVALAQLGELDAAETSFRRALELRPDMPEAVQGLQGIAKLRAAGATTKGAES